MAVNTTGIKNPVGMCGVRLEANVHIVTGTVSLIQNLVKCVEQAGVITDQVMLQPIASSEAVITAASVLSNLEILFDAKACNSSMLTKYSKISLAALIDFLLVIEAPIFVINPLTLITGVRLFLL